MNYNLKISKFQHISGMLDREGKFAKNYEKSYKKIYLIFYSNILLIKTNIMQSAM